MKSPIERSTKSAGFFQLLHPTKSVYSGVFAASNRQDNKEEAELKQQVLSSLLSQEQPLEGFKKYLELLIIKKTGKDSREINLNTEDYARSFINEINKETATMRLEEKLQLRLRRINPNEEDSRVSNHLTDKNIIEENQLLEDIRKKNHLIIHTSKKLKNRMKLEKLDKERLFNLRTMKHFSNLDTFINAKEFLEQLNPLNKKENLENDRIRNLRLMNIIKSIQNKISNFFDDKIKTFMTRFEEETQQEKDLNASKSEKTFSDSSEDQKEEIKMLESDYFDRLYTKVLNKKNNPSSPKIIQSNQKTKEQIILEKKQSVFRSLNRNSKILRHQTEASKEFYNSSSGLKKTKPIKDEAKKISHELMKQLIITDPSLNQREFQKENENSQFDTFYNNTLTQFAKIQNSSSKTKNFSKESDKNSIKNLESLVQDIIRAKQKKESKNEIIDKYDDFKNKASNIIKLISKTSKVIFNEKNRKFSDKRLSSYNYSNNNHEKQYTPFQNGRRKAFTIDQNNVNAPMDKRSDLSTPLQIQSKTSSSKFQFRNPPPLRSRFSMFFEKIKNNKPEETIIDPAETEKPVRKYVSFGGFGTDVSDRNFKELSALIEMKKPKGTTKVFMNRLNHIISQAENVKNSYQEEEKNLRKIEYDALNFYQGHKIKLKPPLESLIMTFEPIEIRKFHKSAKSFYRDKIRKEKQKKVLSDHLTDDQ